MSDFDANDDPLRLSGSGKGDPDPPRLVPRFALRARALAERQCRARDERAGRRVGLVLVAHGRHVGRNACDRRIGLLGSPPRRRRRLWTQCHGRPPGSAI
ncbi:MAG TPA: hypothetical protein VGO29_09640 [Solirubrobacteraceae bacterium]|nr:hypothetical protein [Solirubrobacteraceae bacterium]